MTPHLYLSILGQHYQLKFLSPHPSVALTAWRLTRENRSHDVSLTPEGKAECTCGDYVHRKEKRGQDCKHITSLREVCLLPAK